MQLHLAQSERSRFGQLRLRRVYTFTVVSVLAGIRSASEATVTFPRCSALVPADDIFKSFVDDFWRNLASARISHKRRAETGEKARKRREFSYIFLTLFSCQEGRTCGINELWLVAGGGFEPPTFGL
jgi:hypothetical protein